MNLTIVYFTIYIYIYTTTQTHTYIHTVLFVYLYNISMNECINVGHDSELFHIRNDYLENPPVRRRHCVMTVKIIL